MPIHRLRLSNYRVFVDAEFTFAPKFNLVIGSNGSGKSTLLRGIAAVASRIVKEFNSSGYRSPIEQDDARVTSALFGKKVRFDPRFPVTVQASGIFFDKELTTTIVLNNSVDPPETTGSLYRGVSEYLKTLDIGSPSTLPFFAFYGAHRNTKSERVSLEKAASQEQSRMAAYENWKNALTNGTQLETWYVGKTLEQLQAIAEESLYDATEVRVINKAVARCLPGSTGLRYDLALRTFLVEFDDKVQPFADLSDGQQNMLALIADIGRRICLLNPHLGEDVFSKTDGIIAIDELDLHLHPAWQRRIIRVLKELLPCMQIFATAHSPQMIGELHPEEVIILSEGQASRPDFTFGMDSSRILEEIMDTDSRQSGVDTELMRLFSKVEEGDLKAAREALHALKIEAPGLPDYARAEALIKRKEILGK